MTPKGWVSGTVREVVGSITGGGTPSRSVAAYWGGQIPWASVKDFSDDQLTVRHTEEHITPQGLAASTSKVVESDKLVVCIRMAVGRCAIPERPIAINQDLKALEPKNGLSLRFLLYGLRHRRPILERLGIGSTVKGLPLRDLLGTSFSYPANATEQDQIVDVLDTLDTAILETERVVAKLRQMKQGLLHDLLTRGLDANGELRDPDRHPEQFKDSPLGRIPTTWRVERLGEIVDRSGGLIQTGPFGSQLHAREYVAEGTPVVMPQDMVDGRLVEDEIARITPRRARDLRRHRLQENDVVISRRGDLSRCATIGAREAGWVCGTGCMLVRVAARELDGHWLSCIFRHHLGQRQVMSKAVGSTMVNLNRGILAALLVPNPPNDERRALIMKMQAMDQRLEREQAELPKLRTLKQGLMDDLLTGRVRVSVGEEAGAHV